MTITILNLLELSEVGADFASKLKLSSDPGIISVIKKVNSFLAGIDMAQMGILRKKFSAIGTLDQIFDKLAELLVAVKLCDDRPTFNEESTGAPDLYLQVSKKLVEIKRINESDDEKSVLEVLEKKKVIVGDSSEELARQAEMVNAVNKKADEAITKAIKQIDNRPGIIYLIYRLDLLGYRESLVEREKQFRSYCTKRFNDLAMGKPIEFKIEKFNDILLK